MILNNDFLDYDPRLVDLRNKYLAEASLLYYHTILSEAGQTAAADNQWYIKWKGETVALLKNNFAQYRNYANQQITKYNGWLRNNREFFDTTKYPVDKSCNINNAPNYKAAMMRIKEPITNALNGLNLSRIEVPDDNDGVENDNRWFMKFLIKTYNGDGNDFTKFAKSYYYGEDSKNNLTPQEVGAMMTNIYNYCLNYMQTIHLLENQLQAIITYINRDPVTGQQQTSNDAETQLNNLNRNQQNPNQVASTNPVANAMNQAQQQQIQHAAADYLLMREAFIVLDEFTNAPTTSSPSAVNSVQQSSNTNTPNSSPQVQGSVGNNRTVNPTQPSNKAQQTQQKQNPKGTPVAQVNQKLLVMKKKQVACDLIKDCFHAKVTASGMIYKDFITLLQTHIATVQENLHKKSYKAKQNVHQ